jgi:hypothetical protein
MGFGRGRVSERFVAQFRVMANYSINVARCSGIELWGRPVRDPETNILVCLAQLIVLWAVCLGMPNTCAVPALLLPLPTAFIIAARVLVYISANDYRVPVAIGRNSSMVVEKKGLIGGQLFRRRGDGGYKL